jgi:amino acid transporter
MFPGLKAGCYLCITARNRLAEAESNPTNAAMPRRWSIFAAGFLLLALALVVIYTSRRAFFSPLAMVVVSAIGLAALLMQLRLHRDTAGARSRLVLNSIGLLFAVAAVFADKLRFGPNFLQIAALGAVVCFALSGVGALRSLRKRE